MVKIVALKETNKGEARVAMTPDNVKRFKGIGAEIIVESGAGNAAGYADSDYKDAGANLANSNADALKSADIIVKVAPPSKEQLDAMPDGASLVAMLSPHDNQAEIKQYAATKIQAFALELLPRISRAQSMDVLSSQSNLAGYRAVIEAFATGSKVAPMMMTAAGTVIPAKALILGAGVAGLQAIATAKRLGAVVSAFDVRPAVKEQVESLGAKFIEVTASESGDASGGYAKEMSEDYKQKQSELIHKTLSTQNLVITTALIPGKPAPTLITKAMVEAMPSGAVIVDLAAIAGGNCELTKADSIVEHKGVKIIGDTNLPARCASDSSSLYARNLFNFVSALLIKEGKLDIAWDDELVKGTILTKGGKVVHPQFASATPTSTPKAKTKPAAKTPSTPKTAKPKTTTKTATPATKKPAAKKPASVKAEQKDG